MKYLLGLILLVSVSATSQYSPTSAKTRFVNGIGLGTKDTLTMNAADTVAMIVGRDSLVYFRYKGYWKPLAYNSSLTGYIPYTGATSAIDLNAKTVVNISHLGINTTTVPTILLRAIGDNNSSSRIAMRGYSSDANSSSMRVTKFRGTTSAPQAPQSGDNLGKFELAGYGTTSSEGYPQATFEGLATENWGATARGAKIQFKVTPNTTTTQAIALTINQDKTAKFENSVILGANATNDSTINISQSMVSSDFWKIYGTGTIADQGELVFKVGDNGAPYSSLGERFRFSYDNTGDGTAKDALIIDYDSSYFKTRVVANSFRVYGSSDSYFLLGGGGTVATSSFAPSVSGGYVPYTGATGAVNLGAYGITASSFIGGGSGLTSLPTNTALYPTLNQNTTGNAASASTITINDNTTTSAEYFPVWTPNTGTSKDLYVSSTKLKFNPLNGVLSVFGNGINTSGHIEATYGIFSSGTTYINATTTIPSVSNAKLIVKSSSADFCVGIQANTATGNSYGPFIQAGTNSSDISFLVRDVNNTNDYFKILGNGVISTSSRLNVNGATDDGSTALNVTGAGKFSGALSGTSAGFSGILSLNFNPPSTTGGMINIRDAAANGSNTSFGGVFFNSSPGTDYSIGKLSENANGFLQIRNANTGAELLRIASTGAATFSSLAGTGSRVVVADASGTLSATDAASTSGTYTPTITLVTNAASSTARVCQYMRVGSVVTVSGYVTVTATTPAASSRIYMSLPISSSFTSTAQAGGAGGVPGGANIGTVIFANSTATTVSMDFLPVSGATDYWFTYTYQIL